VKAPIFNGKAKTNQDVETWLLRMKKYFKFNDLSSNMTTKVAIYNLIVKESSWKGKEVRMNT
jgi:hypothetical protein